jgi:hypothetical protein
MRLACRSDLFRKRSLYKTQPGPCQPSGTRRTGNMTNDNVRGTARFAQCHPLLLRPTGRAPYGQKGRAALCVARHVLPNVSPIASSLRLGQPRGAAPTSRHPTIRRMRRGGPLCPPGPEKVAPIRSGPGPAGRRGDPEPLDCFVASLRLDAQLAFAGKRHWTMNHTVQLILPPRRVAPRNDGFGFPPHAQRSGGICSGPRAGGLLRRQPEAGRTVGFYGQMTGHDE